MTIDYIHDTSTLDNATAYKITRLARLLRLHLRRYFVEHGVDISPEQLPILFRLYEKPGQSQSELAAKDLNDHPNITRMVDQLEKRGLVLREADPEDRRRHLVSLTTEGHALMAQILPTVAEERKVVFAGITENEVDELVRIMAKIERNLLV